MGICQSHVKLNWFSSRDITPKKKMKLSNPIPTTGLNERTTLAMHYHPGRHITEDYDVLRVIGEGHLGEISLIQRKYSFHTSLSRGNLLEGELKKYEARSFACKTVSTTRMTKDDMEELINEINIMRELDHPHILQLFDVYHTKDSLWLVMEICSGGDLANWVHTKMYNFTETESAVIIEQMLRAVAYMHTRNVCHRDIKLENVMFRSSNVDNWIISLKLIDFGLSNKYSQGSKMRKCCGTPYSMAPELLGLMGYTEKADVWSLGVVAYILLSGEYPFMKKQEDLNNKLIVQRFVDAKYVFGPSWKLRCVSSIAREFIGACLRKAGCMRWTAIEALHFLQTHWFPALKKLNENSEDSFKSTDSSISDEEKLHLCARKSLARRRSRMSTVVLNGLTKFCSYGQMMKTILMTLASTMDKVCIDELKELFIAMDANNTGTLTYDEFRQALERMHADKHLGEEMIINLFDGMDRDRSGNIHYREFIAAVIESQGLITLERLAEAFERIDVDRKGYITKNDLQAILGSEYDENVLQLMICDADFKNDGKVDYEEFLKFMRSPMSSPRTDDGQNKETKRRP